MIDNETLIALDIETSNGRGSGALDPMAKGSRIALVQIMEENGEPTLFDWNRQTIEKIRGYIKQGVRFLIHNAFFELDWFHIHSDLPIHEMKVWCTMSASQLLNAGKLIPDEATLFFSKMDSKNMEHVGAWEKLLKEQEENLSPRGTNRLSHTLQATIYRYANGARIEKDQGTSDWLRRPLTPEQERYAKDDVRWLHKAARSQWEFIKKLGLTRVAELEMDVILATVDMKQRGIGLDTESWKHSAKEYEVEARELETRLDYQLGVELAEREGEVSLFGTVIPRAFKVSSPTQLSKFFGIESADEAHLKHIDHPAIKDILKFKENIKIASTYGDSYLKFIREDGRIHSMLSQLETATGRYSSRRPNLQNVPPSLIKLLIRPNEGHTLITVDYSSVESRILAYISEDSAYIEAVNSSDVHWENAKRIFGLPPDAQRSGLFTVLNKTVGGEELRRMAKGVSFGIPYGISPVGLVARGFAENADQGQNLINGFLNEYKNVKRFLDFSIIEALTQGYTQNPLGRIRWYEKPDNLDPDAKRVLESSISRQAQNHKIQSTSADVTKEAIRNLYRYLVPNNLGYMTLTVHDSVFFEVRTELLDEVVPNIIDIMQRAGPSIIPGMETPVDLDIGTKTRRECKVTGLPFYVYDKLWTGTHVIDNDAWVEPRVDKLTKSVPKTDYQGKFVELLNILKTKDEAWHSDNQDIVKSVEQLNAVA